MNARWLVLAFALAALPAAAQVYKWVDKDGRTHYGEKPPEGAKSTSIATPPPGPTRSADTPEDWKLKESEFKKRQIDREGKERKEADAQPKPDPARCERARRDVEVLNEQIRVFKRDEKGEKVYLDDADRPRVIAQAKERVAAYCKGL